MLRRGRVLGPLLAAVAAVVLLVAVPTASATTGLRADRRSSTRRDARQPRQGRDPQGGAEEGAQRDDHQPGHLGQFRVLQAGREFIVSETDDWQIWTIERRENLLEDHSFADQAKARQISGDAMFDYYLGYLTDASITTHYQPVPDADVPFARGWGMRVAVMDIKKVVKQATKLDGKVVLGGHSLGGSITTAYATWDFNGKPGAKDLSGLVFVDGGSGSTPRRPRRRRRAWTTSTTARRGSSSAASRRPSPACSTSSARPGRSSTRTGSASSRTGRCCRPTSSRRCSRPTRARTATRSTPRPRRRAWPPPRRTSATSPRAATRARGTTPGS